MTVVGPSPLHARWQPVAVNCGSTPSSATCADPTLEGKLVLRLTMAPSGEVTLCEVVSSELGDAELERKLVLRVKQFCFESRDVELITTTKPIDFFPA